MDIKLDRRSFLAVLSALGAAAAFPKLPAMGKTTAPAPVPQIGASHDIVLDFYRGAGHNIERLHTIDRLEIIPATAQTNLLINMTADKTMRFDQVVARDRSHNAVLFTVDGPLNLATGDTLSINVLMT